MDQHIATDGLAFETIAATVEGLYSLDAAGNTIPAIALSHEVSDDGLKYTFKLRENAKWSNGDKVTANDFVFSWRRLVNPNTASEYNFIADVAGLKNAAKIVDGELPKEELGVKALDDHTLEVELERPTPYFISLTAFATFFPLNEEFVTEKGDQYALNPENILSNGPFKMVEWNKGYGYKLNKNTDYYDAENVKVDGLEFRIIKDPQTAVLKFDSDELDVVKLSAELVEKYKSDESFKLIGAGYLWYMSFNQETELFKNVDMRKAFSHAVDKSHIADNILNDGSLVADFIVPIGLATGPDGKDFRDEAGTYSQYDKALALDYWNQAKSELGKEELEVEVLFDDSETVKKMAEFIQAELETNLPGLTVKLKSQPKKNRLALMRSGDFELGLTRWGPDYSDPLTYLELFITDGSSNSPNYSSQVYDDLVYSASRGDLSSDPIGRWEAMIEAERVLLEEDAAVGPLYQRGYAFLINSKVTGIEDHVVGTPFIYKSVEISE
ncbi:MAG: peptide ABC transporter substrate-binding protein [Firmicutes bacterium]|nr:peptide ABC transporter substrate-binding protein [Bacillota bacterium]